MWSNGRPVTFHNVKSRPQLSKTAEQKCAFVKKQKKWVARLCRQRLKGRYICSLPSLTDTSLENTKTVQLVCKVGKKIAQDYYQEMRRNKATTNSSHEVMQDTHCKTALENISKEKRKDSQYISTHFSPDSAYSKIYKLLKTANIFAMSSIGKGCFVFLCF